VKNPIVMRGEYESFITKLLQDIDELTKSNRALEARIKDIERQFVTEYGEDGRVKQTLADVPIAERAAIRVVRRPHSPMRGMSWAQAREWLERTDGGKELVK